MDMLLFSQTNYWSRTRLVRCRYTVASFDLSWMLFPDLSGYLSVTDLRSCFHVELVSFVPFYCVVAMQCTVMAMVIELTGQGVTLAHVEWCNVHICTYQVT